MPEDMKHWSCRIGEVPRDRELALTSRDGTRKGDEVMRDAVTAAYVELTGEEPVYIFSGWGDPLPEQYRAVVEDREPDPTHVLEKQLDELEATMRHVLMTRNGWSVGDATAFQIRERFRDILHSLPPDVSV